MANIDRNGPSGFEVTYPVVVIGGGACGLCAGLAVRDSGVEVLLLEQDKSLLGTTAMSTGLIPASGTDDQKQAGIEDSPEIFAADIMAKTKGEADPIVVKTCAETSVDTVMWLKHAHNVELNLIDGFLYPGHSKMRMYGMPNRSGSELMGALTAAAETSGVDILTEALVETLYADAEDNIIGVQIKRPDGGVEDIGCEALILACCGFAGDADLVKQYIPEMEKAVFHGHPGNKGHAMIWGKALGAALGDMSAYQGHAGLAYGHGIPILWPLIMEGGFQVNQDGLRFSDETKGYSEQAVNVLEQPGSVAWSIYDGQRHELMLKFDDYQDALRAGAIKHANTIEDLADMLGLPKSGLVGTLNDATACASTQAEDEFGRSFAGKAPLTAPYYGVKVTAALFHTQGGLEIDEHARVLRQNGIPFPNLFAGGGAARGISGSGASGYMAGNGLMTATSLGKLAGRAAAKLIQRTHS